MSFSSDGVRLHVRRRNIFIGGVLAIAEIILSVFLYFAIAAHVLWPSQSRASAGVASMLSYEGRLTDASGNPLGGTGQPYCFRFSIYDSPTVGAGTKLWPAGAPATTISTTTDGVFTALIGQADPLTYNFYDNNTVYLNVDVNTATSTDGSTCSGSWETLSPREQIVASGYALGAKNVYSGLLVTDTANSRVQVGTGVGVANPIPLLLDTSNSSSQYIGQTCTTSGTMWYNSAISSGLICEGGIIQALGNATTTIDAVGTNGSTPISAGTVVFSNSNGLTFGVNGNTITGSFSTLSFQNGNGVSFGINAGTLTASVNAGGGAVISRTMWPSLAYGLSVLTAPAQGTLSVQYFPVPTQVSASRMDVAMSISLATQSSANTAAVAITQRAGIYTLNGNTLMSLSTTSAQQTISWASNTGSYSSITGVRYMSMPFAINATPGEYYMAYEISTANSSIGTATTALAPTLSIFGVGTYASAGIIANNWGLSNTSHNVQGGMGVYTAQVASNLGNLSLSAINQTGANASKANIWIQIRNS